MRSFALLPLLCAVVAAAAVEGPPDAAIVPVKTAVVAPPPNDALVDSAAVYATSTTAAPGYGSAVESPSSVYPPATVYRTVSVSVNHTTTLTAAVEPTYPPAWHSAGPSSYRNSTAYANTTLPHSHSYTKSRTLSHGHGHSHSKSRTLSHSHSHSHSESKPTTSTFSTSYHNSTAVLSTYSAPAEETATATAAATVYPGGLNDPTLDPPCYNASCANPSSDMNFKVTVTPATVDSGGVQVVRAGATSLLLGGIVVVLAAAL